MSRNCLCYNFANGVSVLHLEMSSVLQHGFWKSIVNEHFFARNSQEILPFTFLSYPSPNIPFLLLAFRCTVGCLDYVCHHDAAGVGTLILLINIFFAMISLSDVKLSLQSDAHLSVTG